MYIQQQVEECIRQLSGLDKNDTETKIKCIEERLTCTSNNMSNGHMSMFWLAIIKIE